jgi:hypothetical protein
MRVGGVAVFPDDNVVSRVAVLTTTATWARAWLLAQNLKHVSNFT